MNENQERDFGLGEAPSYYNNDESSAWVAGAGHGYLLGFRAAMLAAPPAPVPEATRSQRLAEAGYTRRPSWKSLPKDGEDETEAKPLTDEQIDAMWTALDWTPRLHIDIARAVELAHGIGASTKEGGK